jgi:hypothetical protein
LNLTQELAVFCDDEQEDVGAMDCVVIGKVLSPASVHVSTIRSAMRLAGAIRPKCNETSRGNLFGLNIIVVGEKAENLFIADLLARISLSNHNTSRKAPLLTPFGANSTQRQLSRHLCVDTGQTGRRENSGGRPLNIARAGSRQGDAHRVALGSARPPRASSDVAEMKEEQQVVHWKIWEEVKVNTKQ